MTAPGPLRVEDDGDVRVLSMAAPPVNLLSRPMREALHAALLAAEADPAVRGVVLTGSGAFSAGGDLAEFDRGEGAAEPTLHLAIAGLLDTMRTPVVAAVSGVALGGGIELALACSARVAAADARIGFPEVDHGFCPGAGGTQRLPRATGMAAAADLVLTGRTVDGREALALGVVDRLVDGDPVPSATDLVRSLPVPPPRLRDRDLGPDARIELERAAAAAPDDDAHEGAAAALRAAVELPFDEGLARELALFQALSTSPRARAGRYRFLSERASALAPGVDLAAAAPVERAIVVGGGTMGRGIAIAIAGAGVPVVVVEADAERADAARGAIADRLARRGPAGAAIDVVDGDPGTADLVVEAVPEDLALKSAVLARWAGALTPHGVLASNTSWLDLGALAAESGVPDRFVGLHFLNPADRTRVVEVGRTTRASEGAVATVVALARRMRRLAVVVRAAPGLVGNRVFDAALRQALRLLATGATPARVDALIEADGFATGPFRTMDLIGLDVLAAAHADDPDPAWRLLDPFVAAGRTGAKGPGGLRAGRGEATEPEVLLPAATQEAVSDAEVVERYRLAAVAEAARLVEQGVARPAQVDAVLVNGFGWPAAQGGPWWAAAERGWQAVADRLDDLARRTGDPAFDAGPLRASAAEDRR